MVAPSFQGVSKRVGRTDVKGPNGGLIRDEVPFDRGVPGTSARRRYKRLHAQREQRAREKFGRLGGVYLALTNDPQSTVAWAQGSRGERLLGEYLEKLQDERVVVVLHDRRIPGTRANIDHIAVSRSGVIWAIDAKNYSGKVRRIDRGGWFSTDLRLYVGLRDCTKLVYGMAKQVDAIRTALGEAVIREFNVDVRAALCFVNAEWPLFAKPSNSAASGSAGRRPSTIASAGRASSRPNTSVISHGP
jgi:hypothetical protein